MVMSMNWNKLMSDKRTGSNPDSIKDVRSAYQRDYDRVIFSSAFRRLQNKTQVFPLPGSVFVHNRLTHSLEVASVGRSLGKLIGDCLVEKGLIEQDKKYFYNYDLQNVIAAACLAHDIGNPPFGHSGEKAISDYFLTNASNMIHGRKLREYFNDHEWYDFICFDGNSNSLRVLIHNFKGKTDGGYKLTYTTLASLIKYPWTSIVSMSKKGKEGKFGFFISEKETINKIYKELDVIDDSGSEEEYKRHPFVYLVEAADDICYRIMDFEDAQRLDIISYDEALKSFEKVVQDVGSDEHNCAVEKSSKLVYDRNEKISFLRAMCINALILKARDVFIEDIDKVLSGEFGVKGIVDVMEDQYGILKEIKKKTVDEIYNHHTVVELEVTGYNVMSQLLSMFIPAVLRCKPEHKEKKILNLIPDQFKTDKYSSYDKVFSVLDYLSGSTDSYIIELYRKTFGIDIPKHA
jgi:dGTPase